MAIKAEYDVLLVGAGFGSICTIWKLRKLGLKCHILEKGSSSGGIWYWNCYPGARVDSDAPIYQLFDKEVWEEFTFTERYPGWQELRRYFEYLDKKIDYKKDTTFNATVSGAKWLEDELKWDIYTADGNTYRARWFIPAIGFAAKEFIPDWKGLDKVKIPCHHTAKWPQEGVEMKGKRIAVVGTGASGVQVAQETAHDSKELMVYQRTPNLACPMNQKPLKYDETEQLKREGKFKEAFDKTYNTFAGFAYDFQDKKTFDDSPEERERFFHNLLVDEGGFRFWLNTYSDMLFDEKANYEAYKFWRDFTRSRINDPRKKEILAPMKPPHPWGTKRPSLEQYYYEIFNLPHVDVTDINEDPIEEFTEHGIRTKSGYKEYDVIAFATGFDAVTGSLQQLDIRGASGETIADHWKNGLATSLGIAMVDFPNMFFLYGPQAPTAFSNGPSCVQIQAEWVDETFQRILKENIVRLEPTQELEDDWVKQNHEHWDASLFPQAKSWYQGANIPGRKVEPLNWSGGIPKYIRCMNESRENNWQGWHVKTAKS